MRWAWFRIAAAVIALSGVVAGFIVNIDRATREAQDLELVLVNYFSMFTIVSALLSAVVLLAAASWAMRHPGTSREPLLVALGLAAVAGPVLLLGIVYNVLLRDAPAASPSATPPGSRCWTPTRSRSCTWCCRSTSSSICCWPRGDADCPGGRWPCSSAIPSAGRSTRWCEACASPTPMAARSGGTPTRSWTRTTRGTGRRSRTSAAMMVAFIAIGAVIIAIGHFREKRAATRGGGARAAGALPV